MFKDSLGKLTQKQDLTAAELTEFVEGIRDDQVTDVQIAGFLVALLMKGPTVDEVAAIARAMRANCVQIEPKVSGNLTDMCGTGGGLTTFNVSTANAILTAAAGVPVAKHGSRSISASSGSADALEALGVVAELTPDQGRQLIEQVGISFLYAPNFHPIMLKVFFPELALGVKTIFFTIIGPLINPAGAPHHMMGVYKPELVRMVGDVVAQLDMQHVIVAHGSGGVVDTAGAGLDEISILGPTDIAEVKGDTVEHYTISPEDFGLKTATFDEIKGGEPALNAEIIRGIFEGRDQGPRRDILVLNNAFALYVAGAAKSPEDGLRLAQENLDSGAASRKLAEFAAASQAIAPPGVTGAPGDSSSSGSRSLAGSIRRRQAEGLLPVLPEIKVRSPKEGDLLRGRAPEDLAAVMAATPIAGLSVVTDLIHFGGDTDIIRTIRPLVGVPILRKDFTRSLGDLDETVDCGADAILLTVCLLDDEPLARLHAAAHERGLETLVEVHDDKEIARVADLGLRPDVFGVNNRDIQLGETDDGDVGLTERLVPTLPPGSVLLSESAITGPDDARRARAAGADAVLVGTSILRAPDPAEAIRALVAVGWPG